MLALALLGGCSRSPKPAGAPAPAPAPSPAVPATPHPVSALPPDTGILPLRLELNIPGFRLAVYQGERLVRQYRVAVGDSSYPTPVGQFAVTWVEWDPWWTPPRSEWAKGDTATPPGPTNPMGRVKLAFQQLYYLHGTPAGGSLGQAASHGCVRLSNADAVQLARLVQHYGSTELSATQVDSIARASGSGQTRRFALARPVLFQVRYDVVEVRHDSLILYPDIYRRERGRIEERIRLALARAGLDAKRLDSTRLAALRLPATGRRVHLLSTLIRPPAPREKPSGPPRGLEFNSKTRDRPGSAGTTPPPTRPPAPGHRAPRRGA